VTGEILSPVGHARGKPLGRHQRQGSLIFLGGGGVVDILLERDPPSGKGV
jgi:hypothetical protein